MSDGIKSKTANIEFESAAWAMMVESMPMVYMAPLSTTTNNTGNTTWILMRGVIRRPLEKHHQEIATVG